MPFSNDKLTMQDLRLYQCDLHNRIIDDVNDGKPGVLLAVEMGLGKTITTLTAVQTLIEQGRVSRVLIVAPLRVARITWPEELEAWDFLEPLTYSVICGTKTQREKALSVDAKIHITNRESLPWLYQEYLDRGEAWPYDMLVYDESSRLKGAREKTSGGKLSEFGVMMRTRQYHNFSILLTGTPAPNGIGDLYGQMKVLDGGDRLGRTLTKFRERYMRADRWGYNWYPLPGAEEQVMSVVDDVMISMSSDDYLELPEMILDDVVVDLAPGMLKRYKEMARSFRDPKTRTVAASAGVLANKLCQFANGGLYEQDELETRATTHDIHDAKIDGLREVVERAGGENLLIAYGYAFDKARIKKAFPDAVAVEDDPKAIEKWNAGKIKMLIAHPAQIGHGLNLQHGGRHLVWYGLTWSQELYAQFNARLRRSGQKSETVFLHHIIAKGTIDETVMKAQQMKGATQAEIMDYVKASLGEPEFA